MVRAVTRDFFRTAFAVALASALATARVGALPPPVADFTADLTNGVAPVTVDFTDLSSGLITSWFWDFGDATTTNLTFSTTDLFHTYANPGTYSVQLTVSGPFGVGSKTEQDYITVVPEPSTLLLVVIGACLLATRRLRRRK